MSPEMMRFEKNRLRRVRYATDTKFREMCKKSTMRYDHSKVGRARTYRMNWKFKEKQFLEYINCCKPHVETKQEKLSKEILDE